MRRVPIALVLTLATGCAALRAATGGVSFAPTAKENYDRGLAELGSHNWAEAVKYFQHTRSKFGFSKWATLAEMGIADAHFGQGKYQEAIDTYRTFMKSHPTHEMVQTGYAAFRIGFAFYKEIPSEWFLVPPAYEKDQGPVHDALRELRSFLEEYSDSPHRAEARKLSDDCVRRLSEHELYVADFYLKKKRPEATIHRLEGLLKDHPGSGMEPQVLLLLGRTYLQMEKPALAKQTFERILARFPDDLRAKKAKLYLDYIARRWGVDRG